MEKRFADSLRNASSDRRDALERDWSEGRALTLQDAAALAMRDDTRPSSAPRDAPPPAADGLLTARELEVAALIARGKTSKEIADELVITERTADTHAAHIRDKLGLRSRAEIAAWAVRQRLLDAAAE
jgi:DNA-binding NarL/FixJ family response regulator